MEPPKRPFYTSFDDQHQLRESANDATALDSLQGEVREVGFHTAANDVASTLEKINQTLNVDILRILELLAECEVESIDLSRLGIALDPLPSWETFEPFNRKAYERTIVDVLGAGHTCYVVRHAEYRDVGRLPKGTVVAMKTFVSQNPSPGQDTNVMASQTLNAIEQEIRTYCHPGLRNHPNICRLEYVAWEAENVFPILALELAYHGSLEDVLTASGTGPSYQQRCNLSIDIALGLAALHEWEIIHGDIKPANILVQKHLVRGIVAKISDFGGTINLMISPSRLGPSMGTDLWWPPERIFSVQDLNFKKVDVYAYGLVVASIWSQPNLYFAEAVQKSCILDRFISTKFSSKERQDRLLLMKTECDSSSDSVLSRCLISAPLIGRLLKSTLSRHPKERKTMDRLLQDELLSIRDETKRKPETRSRTFQIFVSRSIHKGFREALSLLDFAVIDIPGDRGQPWQDVNEFLDAASGFLSLIEQNIWEGRQELRRTTGKFAFHAAISYFTGIGVQIKESEAKQWLRIAALAGNVAGVFLSPLIGPPISSSNQSNFPYRLFLVLGALAGLKESLALLRVHYPSTYHATLQTLQSKRRQNFLLQRPYSSHQILSRFRNAEVINLPTLSVWSALETHNIDAARSLLLRDDSDASLVNDHNVGIMHYLSLLEDSEAAGLVDLCYERGALLDIQADSQGIHLLQPISGTPLAWAVSQNMEKLCKALLQLHKRHCITIVDFWNISYKAAKIHSHRMLASIFDTGKEAPWLIKPRFNLSEHTQKFFLQFALGKAMTSHDVVMIDRRILHGPDFKSAYKQTLLLLLKISADPFDLPCQLIQVPNIQPRLPSALTLSLEHNDEVSMQIFVDHHRLKNLPINVFHHLIAGSILNSARMCFTIIVDAFPDLASQVSAHSSTPILSPLRAASYSKDPFYARMLLNRGAEFMTSLSDGYTPLESALIGGYIETAEEIYNYYSHEQLNFLWKPNGPGNTTLIGKLVSNWVKRRDNLEIVKAIRWVDSKGGAHFPDDIHQPAWNIILFELQPPLRIHARQDMVVLNALFDIFWDKLEFRDAEGLAPIHRAVKTGNLDALEALFDKGVNINVETISHQSSTSGKTALNLAMKYKRNVYIPSEVRKDGPVALKTWLLKMEAIIRALVGRDAGLGSGSTINEQLEYLSYKSCNICSIRYVDNEDEAEPIDNDNLYKRLWPKPLPKDETSPSDIMIGKARARMNIQLEDGRVLMLDRSTVQKLLGLSLKSPDLNAKMPDGYTKWLSQSAHNRCQEWRSLYSRRRKRFDSAWFMPKQNDTMMTDILLSEFVQHTHETYLILDNNFNKVIEVIDPLWSQFHNIDTQSRHEKYIRKSPTGQEELEHDPTLFSLPRFSKVSYTGPKLSGSIHDQNLQHLIKALEVDATLETGFTNNKDTSELMIINCKKSNPNADLLLQNYLDYSTQSQNQDELKLTHIVLLNADTDKSETSIHENRAVRVEKAITACLMHISKDSNADDESTLYFIDRLCALYLEKGEIALWEKMTLRALEGSKRVLGPDHKATLDTLHDLGCVYSTHKRFMEAERMLLQALNGKQRVLGPVHMSTLETIYCLGVVFEDQGRWAESEAKYLLALERYSDTPVPDDSKLNIAINSLNSLHAKILKIQPTLPVDHRVYNISKLLRGKRGGLERMYGCLGNLLLANGDSENATTAYYYQYLHLGSGWKGIICDGCQRSLAAYGLQRLTCELCRYIDLCEDCYPRYATKINKLSDCKGHSFLDLRFNPSDKASDEVKEEKEQFLQRLLIKYAVHGVDEGSE
ncbi:MAG: hypothetical protein Q9187_003445 [Circinaria calcarea]